jgi:DNA-directed RNA polymerase specialized sigma24 family protein
MTDSAYNKADELVNTAGTLDIRLVSEMVEQLGEACRKILTLFYFDGLDMTRIAELMKYANADTAKAKKHQCFKKLQSEFKEKYRKSDFI